MPVDRATFDADLATYVAAGQAQQQLATTYITDVTTLLGLITSPDFSAEDATVQSAIAAVQASGTALQTAITNLPPPPGTDK